MLLFFCSPPPAITLAYCMIIKINNFIALLIRKHYTFVP